MDKDENLKILYAEDDIDTQEELAMFLSKKCDTLYIASDGKEALELFKKNTPNLVITDIQMPSMDGIQLAKEIKKINLYVPIIFVTAFNEVTYLKESIELGITTYIEKPVNLKQLSNKIEEILHPKKAFKATCNTDEELNIIELSGCWDKMIRNSNEIIQTPLNTQIAQNQQGHFTALVKKLRKNEKFYGEHITLEDKNGKVTEVLIDGRRDEDGFEFNLTMMYYFINSYARMQQILNKERALKRILEYKNLIHNKMIQSKTVEDFLDLICRFLVKKQKHLMALLYEMSENENGFELSSYSTSLHVNLDELTTKFTQQTAKEEFASILCSNEPCILTKKEYDICPFFSKDLAEKLPKFMILMPIFLEKLSKPLGVLVVLDDDTLFGNNDELDLFEDIGLAIGLGIDRINDKQRLLNLLNEAKHQSRIDTLTNIYNRLMFSEMLDKYTHQSIEQNFSLSMIYMDLDNFKKINDTYGHTEGDKVLIRFAKTVSKMVRNTDIFSRIGGEEFTILLKDTTLQEAENVAQKLLNVIRKTSLLSNGEIVTVSMGVAEFDKKESSKDFTKRADGKLYEAKRTGKDKICL